MDKNNGNDQPNLAPTTQRPPRPIATFHVYMTINPMYDVKPTDRFHGYSCNALRYPNTWWDVEGDALETPDGLVVHYIVTTGQTIEQTREDLASDPRVITWVETSTESKAVGYN